MTGLRFFGTDGIRGTAGQEPMTAEFAFRVGAAAARTLGKDWEKVRVLIGMDTRESGPMLAHAVSAGLTSRGADVLWLGVMPTPGVAYLTRELKGTAGIVISASHNPFKDNGIKFFDNLGRKLGPDAEKEIEGFLDEAAPITGSWKIGRSDRYRYEDGEYLRFLLTNAPYLDGLKVGLDCANGAASHIAPLVFKQIGARLVVHNDQPNGQNINAECGSTHPQAILNQVVKDSLEVGVTFDGDADRVLLVDRRGRLVTGDHMLVINAISRGEKTVVATVMTNLGIERYLADQGITLIRTQVGDRHVFEELSKQGLDLGGEQSGHILFLDLAPTGDGLLTALQTLSAVRKSGISLETWMDAIPVFPQTLLNIEVESQHKVDLPKHAFVEAAVKRAKEKLGETGRVSLRPSGTESLVRVMVEGPSQPIIHDVASQLAHAVRIAAKEI
jgi:phosphoglucosamine mutase